MHFNSIENKIGELSLLDQTHTNVVFIVLTDSRFESSQRFMFNKPISGVPHKFKQLLQEHTSGVSSSQEIYYYCLL